MNKPVKPNITIPESFAKNGIKTDFDSDLIAEGFDNLKPDVLAGDNLNKFIDDTYKGLNYGMAAADAINLINEGETLTVVDGKLTSGATGGGLEVCDIGMALYVDETKGLRRYLNGQIVDINTNTQAFLNRLLKIKDTNPDYFTTEENWQAEALLNLDGCVYKFVLNYDSTGTNVVSVRLPKYPDYVEINAGGTLPVVGNGLVLGLTDGKKNVGLTFDFSDNHHLSLDTRNYGVAYSKGSSNTHNYTENGKYGVTTDPDKSGIQTTLKQTKLKLCYFIQIATGQETENNIVNDIELNNPSFFGDSKYVPTAVNNLSWLKSEGQNNPKGTYPSFYDWILENVNKGEEGFKLSTATDITDYDFVINTAEETFRLPLLTVNRVLIRSSNLNNGYNLYSDGYLECFGIVKGTTGTVTLPVSYKNTGYKVIIGNQDNNPSDYELSQTSYFGKTLNSFQYFNGYNGISTDMYADWFTIGYADIPEVNLYFYVGETVQNAKLMDAGRIGEILPTKTDMRQAAKASMPSDRFVDLTLGADGTTYTAPADGYFQLAVLNGTSIQFYNKTKTSFWKASTSTGQAFAESIECQAGDVIQCYYKYTTFRWFRFYYAEGSK